MKLTRDERIYALDLVLADCRRRHKAFKETGEWPSETTEAFSFMTKLTEEVRDNEPAQA